jgi:uncharacterized membrane protein HdeD (DUF308 family)
MKTAMNPNPANPCPALACNWWTLALRGVLAAAFGLLALTLPTAAVLLITLAFGAFAFLDGVLAVIAALRRARQGEAAGWLFMAGLVGLAAGILTWLWPPEVSLALSAFLWSIMAAWTVLVGALELATAVRLRRVLRGSWLLGLRGAVFLLLGVALVVLMVRRPLASLVSLGWLVGMASLLSGLSLLAFALCLRQEGRGEAPGSLARPML